MKKENEDAYRWNKVAAWYDDLTGDEGSYYHTRVIFPALLKMMQEDNAANEPLTAIDLGCGQGACARFLAANGYNVIGVDIAPALIKAAKKRNEGRDNPRYITGDCASLLSNGGHLKYDLKKESCDCATIILAIQNISPLSSLLKGARALLKPNGALYIVLPHPCFRIPQYSDWRFNDEKDRQERVIWKYLKRENIAIKANPGRKDSRETIHYHRPLKTYLNALSAEGFAIAKVDELIGGKKEQKGRKSAQIERAKEEIPLFLLLKARKI